MRALLCHIHFPAAAISKHYIFSSVFVHTILNQSAINALEVRYKDYWRALLSTLTLIGEVATAARGERRYVSYHLSNIRLKLLERRFSLQRGFVHIDASINFYLDRMNPVGWITIVFRSVAACIWIVAYYAVSFIR